MKIRNKFWFKSIAVFLAIQMMNMVITPSLLMANNNGPVSSEAVGFEPVDAMDMVNLLTGDVSYVLPLLDIPSPEGGYPLALSYHAGIAMDQEASWVGLGWNINPGAINRSVNGYPDDWKDKGIRSMMYDPGESITTYSLNFGVGFEAGPSLGLGYSWGSNKTSGGSVNFGVGISNYLSASVSSSNSGNNSATTIGVNAGVGGASASIGTGSNGNQYGVGMSSIGISFSTNGSESSINAPNGVSIPLIQSVGASDYSSGSTGFYIPIYYNGFYASFGKSVFSYHMFAAQTKVINGPLYFSSSYRQAPSNQYPYTGKLDRNFIQDVYTNHHDGTSYNINSVNIVTGIPISEDDKVSQNVFMFPAYDNYLVSAQGLSGSMTPHIFEYADIYGETKFFSRHGNGAIEKEVVYNWQPNLNPSLSSGVTKTPDKIYFNFDYSNNSYLRVEGNHSYIGGFDPIWNMSSNTILSSTANGGKNNYNATTKRKGGGKYIEWFKNSDIVNNPANAKSRGFIETPSIDESRTNTTYFDPDGIGAYSITTEDGKTFHYSLPVYQYEEILQSKNQSNMDFEQVKPNKYAYTWLLTAVTGPDYMDTNNDGMVSEGDYGYWVNLDYGKWTDGHIWKTPYDGFEISEGSVVNFTLSRVFGRKQVYYLNSIQTRTHTAYFVKSLREDALGQNDAGLQPLIQSIGFNQTTFGIPKGYDWVDCNTGSSSWTAYNFNFLVTSHVGHLPFTTSNPVKQKSLKLDEIILVKNSDATIGTINNSSNHLISNPGSSGGYLYYQSRMSNIRNTTGAIILNDLCSGDIFTYNVNYENNVLDIGDFTDYLGLKSKAIKVIQFNQNYLLAKNTPNSDATGKGKLTLNSVKIFGKGGVDVMPSYEFDYHDPTVTYDKLQIDNWGYHIINSKAWSLKEILTPLGSKIKIDYESDTYFGEAISVNDETKRFETHQNNVNVLSVSPNEIEATFSGATNELSKYFKPNQYYSFGFRIESILHESCQASYKILDVIESSSGDKLRIEMPYNSAKDNCVNNYFGGYVNLSTAIFLSAEGIYNGIHQGGGIRAKSITTEDELGNNYVTEYDYSSPLTMNTSGITSYAPSKSPRYIPYEHNIPGPGVMYEYVTVKNKGLIEQSESVTEYHFEVLKSSVNPKSSAFQMGNHFIVEDSEYSLFGSVLANNGNTNQPYIELIKKTTIKDNTASLGRLLEIKVKNKKGLTVQGTKYNYKELSINDQGITQESFKYKKSYVDWWDNTHVSSNTIWSINTSSIIEYPSVISSVSTTNHGQTKTIHYDEYDFNTGKPLKTTYADSWGNVYKTKVVPAYNAIDFYGYKPYAKMGSKVDDITNKNMLVQDAETYLFAGDNNNTVSASIQTWSNDWSYRAYDVPNFRYTDVPETIESKKVWRKHQNYVWKTNVGTNGTFGVDEDAPWNWTVGATQDPRWKKINEITKYNHYSQPLESTDIVGKYASTKMGYNDARVITTAVNTKYTDFAFSGAEDMVINNHFGGEVLKGGVSTLGTKYVHTGKKSLNIPDGEFGFVYRYYNHDVNKKYKASIWVHAFDHAEIRLAAIMKQGGIGGTTLQYITSRVIPGATKQADNWYLLELEIPNATEDPSILNSDYLEIQLYNPSGLEPFSTNGISTVDDFMVHPITAPMTSYVYDDETGLVTAIIDNNGMATKYAYDAAGKLIATYKEVLNKGFVKTAEYNYNYAR